MLCERCQELDEEISGSKQGGVKMERRHLGVVMGRGDSRRLPHKNRQLVAGKPLIEHSANTLKYSGMFDRVVFTTDTEEMVELGEQVDSIDECHLRNPEWDNEGRIAPSVPYVVQRLITEQDYRWYDSVTYIVANLLFIRPSWVRVALDILFNYQYLDDNISMVTLDAKHCPIAACRINRYGDMMPIIYELPHSGIYVDIDYPWDLDLARQIGEQIEAGNVDLPYDEYVQDSVFEDANKNHMRGLQLK